jgi:uncharacterized protein (TIGR02145 family)
MTKTSFIVCFFCTSVLFYSFSQSKKEQIEVLTSRVDSLNRALNSERKINSDKTTQITTLNKKISILESDISDLNKKMNSLTNELTMNKSNLDTKEQELIKLQSELHTKADSLMLMRIELNKLKPAPEPILTNNTNSNKTNQSAQTSQTGGYKPVKIGTQTWMTENLNVSTFRNGDPILEAKTDAEWKKASENRQPAWCYYNNNPTNGEKYGKLYNWYAVNDARGLAPAGWHIPSDADWTILTDYLGGEDTAGEKMKFTDFWTDNYGESGNGTNESGFSGLPGGERYTNGRFSNFGSKGGWWSSTENYTGLPWNRYLNHNNGNVYNVDQNKTIGFSVRCLKD